ncbi:hypothetical protein GOBAR_AA38408 [Gossypium barbadense]|uniref:Uncharacterized protein n=1 Tax=Gossypium barbadense TaxID=3634 RepID=A0A2P5VTZ5_GOSBA|nr:hypothetical protein GOBAR_AA38408 [Gossypium barbadense]
MDAQRAISRLNGFVILGSRIWIKLAKFKGRRHIWRKVSSQRKTLFINETNQEGVKGEKKRKEYDEELEVKWVANTSEQRRGDGLSIRKVNQTKLVHGHIENEQLWKLQKCLVGEVASFCETRNLADRVVTIGLGEISVKRV